MSYSQSYYSNGDDHRSIKRRRVSDQSYDTSITSHQFYEPPQEAPAAPSFKAKDGSRMVWDQKAAKWVKEVEVKVEEPANPAPSFTAKDGTRMIWDVKSSKWVKDTKQHTISLAPVSIQPLHRGHEDSRYSNAYHIQDQNGSGASSGPFVIPASNVMYDPTQPADQYPTTGMSYNNPSLDSTSFSIDDLIKGLQQPASSHVPINSAPTPPKPPIIIQPSPIEQIDLPTRRDSQSPETVGASGIEQLFKDVDWSRADRKTLHDVFYHMDGEMFASHYDEDTTMKDEESATSKFPVKSKSNGTTCRLSQFFGTARALTNQ